MPVRFLRSALVLLTLATLATACGNADPNTDPNDAGADPTVEPSAGAPPQEGTGDESPAPGGGGKPAIETASAPAGRAGLAINGDAICIYVKWLGQGDAEHLSQNRAFKVTDVSPSGATPSTVRCAFEEPCEGFTFDSNADICYYAVTAGEAESELALSGQVLCSESADNCQKFLAGMVPTPIEVPPASEVEETEGPEPSAQPSAEPSEEPPPSEPTYPESAGPDEQPSPGQ